MKLKFERFSKMTADKKICNPKAFGRRISLPNRGAASPDKLFECNFNKTPVIDSSDRFVNSRNKD